MNDPGLIVWPYGPEKFRGKVLGSIPSGFLRWAAENCRNDRLASAADAEWQHREKYNCHFYEEGEEE